MSMCQDSGSARLPLVGSLIQSGTSHALYSLRTPAHPARSSRILAATDDNSIQRMVAHPTGPECPPSSASEPLMSAGRQALVRRCIQFPGPTAVYGTGGVAWPSSSRPQQTTVPPNLVPQVWWSPAPTAANAPPGGEACPSSFRPQQAIVPSDLIPQVCGPALSAKAPAGNLAGQPDPACVQCAGTDREEGTAWLGELPERSFIPTFHRAVEPDPARVPVTGAEGALRYGRQCLRHRLRGWDCIALCTAGNRVVVPDSANLGLSCAHGVEDGCPGVYGSSDVLLGLWSNPMGSPTHGRAVEPDTTASNASGIDGPELYLRRSLHKLAQKKL